MRRFLFLMVAATTLVACDHQADAPAAAATCIDGVADDARTFDTATAFDAPVPLAESSPPEDTNVDSARPDYDADALFCDVVPLPIQACGVDRCHVVVRLDYDTKLLLDYVSICEAPHAPLRSSDVAKMVQARLALPTPADATMTGFDLAVFQPPFGATGVGGFAFVDHRTSQLVVGATIETTLKGGAIAFPHASRWTTRSSRWRSSCKPKKRPTAVPVFPGEGPAFGAYLAGEAVDAAWNGAIGWGYEKYVEPGSDFTAAAFRYAPTYRGTFRDWIVVVTLGTVPCSL